MIKFTTIAQKSLKYTARQKADISVYGKKQFCGDKYGITDAMINEFTPFRRVSKKTAKLSDSKYFISKFEQETGQDYLPLNWKKMDEAEKVDFIVKERYSGLVAHKIMSHIQAEPVEHHFSLAADGELLTHDIGNKNNVFPKNLYKLIYDNNVNFEPKISIHNHSKIGEEIIMEHIKKTEPKAIKNMGQLHSNSDISNNLYNGYKSYLIDSFGNKFLFIPKNSAIGDKNISQNAYFDIKAINLRYFNDYSERDVFFRKFDDIKKQRNNQVSHNISKDLDSLMLYIKFKAERYKKVFNLKRKYNMYKNYIEEKANIGKLQIL